MAQIYQEPLPAALMYDKNEAELAPKNNKGKKCLGGMLILKVITSHFTENKIQLENGIRNF